MRGFCGIRISRVDRENREGEMRLAVEIGRVGSEGEGVLPCRSGESGDE